MKRFFGILQDPMTELTLYIVMTCLQCQSICEKMIIAFFFICKELELIQSPCVRVFGRFA